MSAVQIAPAALPAQDDDDDAVAPILWHSEFDTNATVAELKAAVLKEKWFDSLIMGKPGLMLQGGSMLGVTTQVWAVKDRLGNERAVCGLENEANMRKAELEREAEELARHQTSEGSVKQQEKFSVELVWDSPSNCSCARAMGFGAFTTYCRGLQVEVGENGELMSTKGAATRVDESPAPFATATYTELKWIGDPPPTGK